MIKKTTVFIFIVSLFLFSCEKNEEQLPVIDQQDGTTGLFSGYWGGFQIKTNSETQKDLYLYVQQFGDSISGYVTAPSYAFQNQTVQGRISGSTLTFSAKDVDFTGTLKNDTLISGTFDYYDGIQTGEWEVTKMEGKRLFNYKMLTPIDTVKLSVYNARSITTDGENFYIADNSWQILKVGADGTVLDTIQSPVEYPSTITWEDGRLVIGSNNYNGTQNNNEQFYFLDPAKKAFSNYTIPDNGAKQVGFVMRDNKRWVLTEAYLYELDEDGSVLHSTAYNDYYDWNTRNGLASDGTNFYFTEESSNYHYVWYKVNDSMQVNEVAPVEGYYVKDVTFNGKDLVILDSKAGQIRMIDTSDYSVISSISVSLTDMEQIAWDGSNIWVSGRLGDNFRQLHKIGDDGSVLESVDYPEFLLSGLDFYNGRLQCAQWDIVYSFTPDARIVEKVKASDNFYLLSNTSFNSNTAWTYDVANRMIEGYSFTDNEYYQFPCAGADPERGISISSLAVDDNYIWVSCSFVGYMLFIEQYDKAGNLLNTYYSEWTVVNNNSMVSNGNYIWYIGTTLYTTDNFIYTLKITQ